MITLPRRAEHLDVEIGDGVVIEIGTLSDAEFFRIMEKGSSIKADNDDAGEEEAQELEFKLPYAQVGTLFARKVKGIRGVQMSDGKPFNPKSQLHLADVPQPWKITAITRIVSYGFSLPKETGKDSEPQPTPSPTAEVPQEQSEEPVSVAS